MPSLLPAAGCAESDTGQCPVMSYHRELLISIVRSRISVAAALNVEIIGLEQAPAAYARFNKGEPVKFIIDPHRILRRHTDRSGEQKESEEKQL
jgi:hypothetical protein